MNCEHEVYITELKQILDLLGYSLGYIHSYSNTRKVFGYTANNFGAYFVNIYIFKAIFK